MLIDCHIHTSEHSSCAVIDAYAICSLALKRGLDAVVFTDHHHRWNRDELSPLRNAFPDLGLYSGVEISLEGRQDLLVIGPDVPETTPRPVSFASLKKSLRPVREEAFIVLAHAFRYIDHIPPALEEILEYVDALELNSVNILRSGRLLRQGRCIPERKALYQAAMKKYGLVGIYNSDAHYPDAVGAVYSEIPDAALPPDTAGLAAMLRSTKTFAERQDAELLERFFDRFEALRSQLRKAGGKNASGGSRTF